MLPQVMHGHVTAGLQRLTQGGIDNFDLESTRSNAALSLKFSIKALSLMETSALKQTKALSQVF
jgi:hypothetical protein